MDARIKAADLIARLGVSGAKQQAEHMIRVTREFGGDVYWKAVLRHLTGGNPGKYARKVGRGGKYARRSVRIKRSKPGRPKKKYCKVGRRGYEILTPSRRYKTIAQVIKAVKKSQKKKRGKRRS